MQHQLTACAAVGSLFLGSSFAAQPAPANLLACAQLSDATMRLACYDREIAALSAATPRKERPAVMLSPEQKMGLPQPKIEQLEARAGSAPELKELRAHIAGVAQTPVGRQLFTLDNGQVWQQTESSPDFTVHPGEAIAVTPGALGSYWLSTGPRSATRVRRIR